MTDATPAEKRLMKDYMDWQKDPPDGIEAQPRSDDDLLHWDALIEGCVFSPLNVFYSTYFKVRKILLGRMEFSD